ncbi:O-antigen ligase family protein [Sphingomonas ginsenosidivorax]|nr:O-antigen ligase family protein [Sphingomonas ginsenosidivorax]
MALLGSRRPVLRGKVVLGFVLASILLAALQLVPLPPAWWAGLPGRSAYAVADVIAGGAPPWRPMAIVPSLTRNALNSLVVPLATVLLIADPRRVNDRLILRLLVCLVVATMGLGLLQFAGIPLYVPIINGGDEISGNFANKNHYALVMAFGLMLVPVWAFYEQRAMNWRVPVTLALIPLLVLAILASGSRAGMAVGIIALAVAGVLVRRPLRYALRRYPRWVLPSVVGGMIVTLVSLFAVSFVAGRAVSVDRALALDPSQDMRRSGLPTVWAMVGEYFPIGAGLGSFDTIFRQHEPISLLKLTYFNRAHDDFLEIVLDAGLLGLVLMMAVLGWWAAMSWRVWRPRKISDTVLPRVGSAMLLLTMLASIVDYPARTPMIMFLVVIAAVWLGEHSEQGEGSFTG